MKYRSKKRFFNLLKRFLLEIINLNFTFKIIFFKKLNNKNIVKKLFLIFSFKIKIKIIFYFLLYKYFQFIKLFSYLI